MIPATNLRKGMVIRFNGDPHKVLEVQHRTPGNLRAFVQASMRNLKSGRSMDTRFGSTDTVEQLTTDTKRLEFSYKDRETYTFMDPQTYETVELEDAFVGDAKNYLVPNTMVDVQYVDDKPISIDLPSQVGLKVIESAEGIRGDSANNVMKPAKLETGITVNVPLFIKEGEVIKINTTSGEYLGRA
jgi:elongation factor P